jgi:hypothetical protein
MSSDGDGWVLSDAWVLAAVRVTGTRAAPASLTDLIAAIDTVHRLIPSHEQLEHGAGRLQGTGLIQAEGQHFWVTPAGRSLVAHARPGAAGRPPGNAGRTEALFRLLSGIPVSRIRWTLDERAYETACLEYRHTMWEEFHRGRQPGRRPRASYRSR